MTVAQLRHNRRYAIVACAAVAAFLPGDFITLLLETVPLYLLYEASILVAAGLDRTKRRSEQRTAGHGDERDDRGRARARAGGPWGADRAADHRPHRRHSELMLFDLRGRGRRNTVRVIYIGLAVLIGVGLVGFGVGGGFGGGGILNSAEQQRRLRRRELREQDREVRKGHQDANRTTPPPGKTSPRTCSTKPATKAT